MDYQETTKALAEGKKVTHKLFDGTGWVMQLDDNHYQFEDGTVIHPTMFWYWRTGPGWDSHWIIVEED